jgi:hypothetical protein
MLGLLGHSRVEEEFSAELESHMAMDIDEGIREGLTPEEARRQALIRLGGEAQVRQAYRDRATVPLVLSIMQDVRFALRQMRKAPGFTLTAVFTLALGIGANAIIFTLVDSILLRPLPYPNQDRLMRIVGSTMPVAPKGWIRALGSNSKAFSSIAGYGEDGESNVSDNDVPDRVFGASVTVNAFDALGIHPALGDFFSADDAIVGQDHDVVLSYAYPAFWRRAIRPRPDAADRRCIPAHHRSDPAWSALPLRRYAIRDSDFVSAQLCS